MVVKVYFCSVDINFAIYSRQHCHVFGKMSLCKTCAHDTEILNTSILSFISDNMMFISFLHPFLILYRDRLQCRVAFLLLCFSNTTIQ